MQELNAVIKQLIAQHGVGFSIIPDYIKRDHRLTATDKLIYAELLRLSHSKGYAWPSYEFLAMSVGCSRPQSIRAVKNLVGVGLLVKKWQSFRSNRYFLTNRISFRPQPTTNITSLAHYRQRRDEKRKAAAQIMTAATRGGLLKDQIIENALRMVLTA